LVIACFKGIKKPYSDEQGFFKKLKKNYFLVVSAAAVVSVEAVVSTTAVATESEVTAVESVAVSVLEVQAAKEATHATNKIAITFFIVF
jgi:hypothetical protein